MILAALAAATLMLAETTPAAAAAAATSPTTVSPATVTATPAAAAKKPDRLICRSESVTGSLMPKKTCYLESEIAQRKQDERQNLERIQSQVGLAVH
jgi:hypothetical protein